MNNGKPNGGTWKTPQLDIALNSKSGFRGGETGQRFYMKFPIYRPRGAAAPNVHDNIDAVWSTQITPMAPSDKLRGGSQYNTLSSGLDSARKDTLKNAGSNTLGGVRTRFNENTQEIIDE